MRPRFLRVEPPEIVIQDRLEPCPYLDGRIARMPVRMPLRKLDRSETDGRLARGDRRFGRFLYRPTCPACQACEPIRLDAERFRPSRSHRRTLARGDAELVTEFGEPQADRERLDLFTRHKVGRGLDSVESSMGLEDLAAFVVERCVDSFELRMYWRGGLAGVAITDRGATALSAVYCYFDPGLARLGLGTYAILKQLGLCRRWSLRHLYLGYYVADNVHMSYKARFKPHERRVDGAWRKFDGPERG